jgi:hypothetical protein
VEGQRRKRGKTREKDGEHTRDQRSQIKEDFGGTQGRKLAQNFQNFYQNSGFMNE